MPSLCRTGKNTCRIGEIQLFQLVNAYRTETRKRRRRKKKKKNVFTLSSLHSPASVVVSETHSAWPVLPQTPNLLDRLSPSPFLIYFLFSLSSFFFLLFGCVQFVPNNLNLNFFKHLIKLIACKCVV